jgi:TIR domain
MTRQQPFVSQGPRLSGTITRFAIVGCVLDVQRDAATLTLILDWELEEEKGGVEALATPWRATITLRDFSGAFATLASVVKEIADEIVEARAGQLRRHRFHVEVEVQVPLASVPTLEVTIRREESKVRSPSNDLIGYADAPDVEAARELIAPQALRWLRQSGLAPEEAVPEAAGEAGVVRLRSEKRIEVAGVPGDTSVFCPPVVGRSTVFLVQVLLYQRERANEARDQAIEADSAAQRRGVLALPPDLPPGTRLDLHLEVPGLRVHEPDASLVWTGTTTAAQFEVAVPADAVIGNTIGRMRISIAGVPTGTLRFQFNVAASAAVQASQDIGAEVRRYRRAFVSYSFSDRAEVLRRVQAFRIAGISVFQDVLDLEPGQLWEHELYREIDRCDVVLLFWSAAAAASPWVAKEIDYALSLKQGRDDQPPDIAPVPIEGPPIPPPPERLRHLHFNDALLAHIATARVSPKS